MGELISLTSFRDGVFVKIYFNGFGSRGVREWFTITCFADVECVNSLNSTSFTDIADAFFKFSVFFGSCAGVASSTSFKDVVHV